MIAEIRRHTDLSPLTIQPEKRLRYAASRGVFIDSVRQITA